MFDRISSSAWTSMVVFTIIILSGKTEKSLGSLISAASETLETENEFDTRVIKVKLPANYSIHQPPPLIDNKPIPVEFSILLFNVFDIKELMGDLSLEVNIKLYWTDTRLANWTGVIEETEKFTVLNPSLITEIWHPDVFIDHMKGISQPSLITKAASLRIYPDGSLRYSARMLLVMSCHMDFYYYPADTQTCKMDFKSYAFSTQHIRLGWRDGIGPSMAYPINVHNFDVAVDTAPDFFQETKSSSYSGIRFELFLRRKLSYHIIQTFIPSALFTIVSWLSFLVPPESTPGRMAICVTTLLTLTAMFASVRQNTPSVSYIKALDIWMVTCIIFVFSVMVEYTTVLKLRNMKDKKKAPMVEDGATHHTSNYDANVQIVQKHNQWSVSSRQELLTRNNQILELQAKAVAEPLLANSNGTPPTNVPVPVPATPAPEEEKRPSRYFVLACKIEKYTPRIMPIAFIFFNCCYWPYLLLMSNYYSLRQGGDMYYSV